MNKDGKMTKQQRANRDIFFQKQFNYYYEKRWKAKGKTQEEFAEAIRMLRKSHGTQSTASRHSVINWLSGKQYPEMSLEDIAVVLDVDPAVFDPEIYDAYSLDGITNYDAKREDFAQKIGLNLSFMKYCCEEGFIGKHFIYNDIMRYPSGGIGSEKKELSKNKAAEIKYKIVVREATEKEEGSYYLIGARDIRFMKHLQDQMKEFARIETEGLYRIWKNIEVTDYPDSDEKAIDETCMIESMDMISELAQKNMLLKLEHEKLLSLEEYYEEESLMIEVITGHKRNEIPIKAANNKEVDYFTRDKNGSLIAVNNKNKGGKKHE